MYQHACQVSISQGDGTWDGCPGASILWYPVAEGLPTAAYSRRLLGTSQPASTPNRTGLARPYAWNAFPQGIADQPVSQPSGRCMGRGFALAGASERYKSPPPVL